MLAFHIHDIKLFMSHLLNHDTFNHFLLKEVKIQTANTFMIDGHLNQAFFTPEELQEIQPPKEEWISWKEMQPLCFQLIKGKKLPLLFKLTLLSSPQDTLSVLNQTKIEVSPYLNHFVLTIKYDQHGLLLTTGTSFSTFIMDKTLDFIWDDSIRSFLRTKGIHYDCEE